MIKLADFGLSRKLNEISDSNKNLYGMVPYIDPQHFKNQRESNKPDMQQIFSELKLIHLNTEDMNSLPADCITDGMQLIEMQTDAMQTDENLITINLDNNEFIINELLFQYEDSIQKGISKNNRI